MSTTSIDRDDSKRLMVFAGRSSQELGSRIAARLGIDLGEVGDVGGIAGACPPPDKEQQHPARCWRVGNESMQGVQQGIHTLSIVDEPKVAEHQVVRAGAPR